MSDDEIVRYFHRHVVPMIFAFRVEGKIQRYLVTTFVMSVSGQWYLITAGHCIRQIDEDIAKYGLHSCYLIDSLGSGATHYNPIPFPYGSSSPVCLSDDRPFDYGFIQISDHYRSLLEANNIVALDENVWKYSPTNVERYLMLGIPKELAQFRQNDAEITPVLIPVYPLRERPEGFPLRQISEIGDNTFYGRIVLDDTLTSIVGMSGGPIFAFHEDENDKLRYTIAAIQSSWIPPSYIAASRVELLGNFLEYINSRR